MAEDWIDIREATRLSGYHADHLRVLIRQGRIRGRKVVIVWLVNRSSLLAYLRAQSKKGEKRGRKPSH
jgi:Helix-turn-helix domain